VTLRAGSVAAVGAMVLCLACDPGADAPGLDIAARPADAPGGAEIARDIRALELEDREERIYAEVARGNVPTWLRPLQRVELTGEVDGHTRHVTFWVTPDYLAVGSDDDFFFVPLSPRTALRIARLTGGSLPTPRMVDTVWASARVRLVPIRLRPDEFIWTMQYFERHDRLVQAQRSLLRTRPGTFVAGHKLDVVLAASPVEGAADVALYGWHHTDGTPIQPLYHVPVDTRPHFSMGLRIVHRDIVIDGATARLEDVLHDPGLARLLAEPAG
jgi:hypothetical protein